jgi:hypothetical protein
MEKVEKIEKVELPCSTSFLLTVNFDYLKECIEFFHKHINILYEKVNDLNKKYKNFEDLKNEVKENKIKTESGLRLLNELDNRISNYGENILKNSEKSYSNEQKIKALQEEIEKLKKMNPSGDGPDLSKLEENLKELKEEVDQSNYYNRDNIDKLNKKAIELEEKIEKLEGKNNNDKISYEKISSDEKKDEENNNLDGNKNGSDNDDNNKRLNELTRRVEILEMNMSKSGDKNIEYTPSKSDAKVTEIKEIKLNDAGNDNIKDFNTDSIDKKLKEFSDKINKLEKEIKALRSNGSNNININLPLSENDGENENNLNNEENNNKNEDNNNNNEDNNNGENKNEQNENEEKKDNQNQEITSKETKGKDNRYLLEIMSQISQINNRLSGDDLLKKAEFNKFVQKIELQLKDYNEKFNKIFQKDALRNKLIEDMSKNNKDTSKKTNGTSETKIITGNTGNYVTMEMFQDFEERFPDLIVNYLSEFDFSSNPSIEKLQKYIDENRNMIKELQKKIDEIILNNTKDKDYYNDIIDNLKKDVKNNIKKVETELDRLQSMKEDLDFLRVLILGQEEDARYQKMTKEERKNELLIGTSIKEELSIQSNYLKKLSEGLNKVNSRINNLNKEILAMIKKDLKNESNLILDDFKSGLKDSIGKIERQLKDKVDKLGLDEFWNKINDQLISEMKEKIDKKELTKNNMLLKRKIDNLESKISRTLVDTLIDLQMDETPLVVKRNYRDIRDITGPKCASCGQNLPNGININNGMISSSSDFTGLQNKAFKHYNISEKDKLPDIKQNLPK